MIENGNNFPNAKARDYIYSLKFNLVVNIVAFVEILYLILKVINNFQN